MSYTIEQAAKQLNTSPEIVARLVEERLLSTDLSPTACAQALKSNPVMVAVARIRKTIAVEREKSQRTEAKVAVKRAELLGKLEAAKEQPKCAVITINTNASNTRRLVIASASSVAAGSGMRIGSTAMASKHAVVFAPAAKKKLGCER